MPNFLHGWSAETDPWTGARIRLSFACCLAWSSLSFFLMQNLEKIKRIYCGCLCWQRCTRSWRTRVWVRWPKAVGEKCPGMCWQTALWQTLLGWVLPGTVSSFRMTRARVCHGCWCAMPCPRTQRMIKTTDSEKPRRWPYFNEYHWDYNRYKWSYNL